MFTAMLLSLAGISLTMGFECKFYVVTAGVSASLWLHVIVLAIGSTNGLFYCLRIIAAMCATISEPIADNAPVSVVSATVGERLTLATRTFLLLWLSVYPEALILVLRTTIAHLH